MSVKSAAVAMPPTQCSKAQSAVSSSRLASPLAAYVCGQTLIVDGGLTLS